MEEQPEFVVRAGSGLQLARMKWVVGIKAFLSNRDSSPPLLVTLYYTYLGLASERGRERERDGGVCEF